jgi:hypothetical protein
MYHLLYSFQHKAKQTLNDDIFLPRHHRERMPKLMKIYCFEHIDAKLIFYLNESEHHQSLLHVFDLIPE